MTTTKYCIEALRPQSACIDLIRFPDAFVSGMISWKQYGLFSRLTFLSKQVPAYREGVGYWELGIRFLIYLPALLYSVMIYFVGNRDGKGEERGGNKSSV